MKNIHIFLPFEKKNIKVAEITRGGVYATSLPRNNLKEINELKETLGDYKLNSLTTAGIYFLIGDNNELEDTLDVYIGKAEDCLARINQHNNNDEKDFQKIIIITASKGDYNIGHATYLEHNITKRAKEAERCNITNKIEPSTTKISPEIKSDLEFDIASIKILMEVLNLNILAPKKVKKQTDKTSNLIDKMVDIIEESELFYCKSTKGAEAQAIYNEDSGRMLVLEGSKLRKETTNSFQDTLLSLRKKLLDESILLENESDYTFSKNYEFKSPSTASAVILGRSSNGWTDWKNKKNKTLKDVFLS